MTEYCAVIGMHSTVRGDKLLYGQIPYPFPRCGIGSGHVRLGLYMGQKRGKSSIYENTLYLPQCSTSAVSFYCKLLSQQCIPFLLVTHLHTSVHTVSPHIFASQYTFSFLKTTELELKEFFGQFGHVKDSKIITDRSGVSKG